MKRSTRRWTLASLLAISALATACPPPPWAIHERHEERHEQRDDHRDERHDNHDERHDDRHDSYDRH